MLWTIELIEFYFLWNLHFGTWMGLGCFMALSNPFESRLDKQCLGAPASNNHEKYNFHNLFFN